MAKTKSDSATQYDRFKKYHGAEYTGMSVGGTHKWYYDKGEWRERKVTPEDWKIYYQTTKRRAGKAPDESGVPVGTEYNWLIVSHQRVDKLDANSYMTCMEGHKFKIAHKRAGKHSWNISEKTQRRKVIECLERLIAELKTADESAASPWTVDEQERIYGLELRNMQELRELAAEMEIAGRSKMKREALVDAIEARLRNKEPAEKAELTTLNRIVRDERHRIDRHAA